MATGLHLRPAPSSSLLTLLVMGIGPQQQYASGRGLLPSQVTVIGLLPRLSLVPGLRLSTVLAIGLRP
jgi:hypothetical protein